MNGLLKPLTYLSNCITIVYDECEREGRYQRETLINQYGADASMPDILNQITDCSKNRRFSVNRCRAVFEELRVQQSL